jgi:hypothetical protein
MYPIKDPITLKCYYKVLIPLNNQTTVDKTTHLHCLGVGGKPITSLHTTINYDAAICDGNGNGNGKGRGVGHSTLIDMSLCGNRGNGNGSGVARGFSDGNGSGSGDGHRDNLGNGFGDGYSGGFGDGGSRTPVATQ